MHARTAREWQLSAITQHVLAVAIMVLLCTFCCAGLLHANTKSVHSRPQADHPCPDCRVQAEQLRDAAGLLVKRATHADLNKALAQLRESARLFQQDHATVDVATNYIKIGEIYKIWGRYRPELGMYDQALKLARDSDIDLKCSILSHRALAYVNSDIDKSLDLANQAVALSKAAADPSIEAEALQAFGEASFAHQAPKEPLEAFRKAAKLFSKAKNLEGEAQAWLFIGYAAFQGDNPIEDSNLAFQKAIGLWKASNSARGMAVAGTAMALYLANTGDIQQATEELDRAQSVFRLAGDRDNEAIVLNERGIIAAEIGNYEDSLRYYKKARKIFAEIGEVRGETGAIDGAAEAEWTLHRPEKALQFNEMKLGLAKRIGLPRYQAAAIADLASYYALQGNSNRAETLYLEALGRFRSLGEKLVEAPLLIQLGRLYSQKGQGQKALSVFQSAIDASSPNHQFKYLARAHFEVATIRRQQSRLDDAKNEIETVLEIIESQRKKILVFDERASYFAFVHEYYQFYVDTLMQLDQQNPGQDFARKALEANEKSRVRSLLDMLGYTSTALPLHDIQEEIRADNAVVLEYALGKKHSYLWVIDQDHMVHYEISKSTAQLLRMHESFHKSLMANGPHAMEAPQQRQAREKQASRYIRDKQELAEALLGPALGSMQGKTAIIVPDGFLQYVPFAALLPSDQSDLVILPSASTLKALREKSQARPPATAQIAIFSDPVFEKDDGRLTRKSSATNHDSSSALAHQVAVDVLGSSYIPRLPNSHFEAAAIVKAFGRNRVYLREGFDANRPTALNALSSYKFIHFATHEFLDIHRPELSGLVLSMVNKDGKGQDGYLRLRDIYSLHLSADLVVLSACESALGRDLDSEGMIGLTRAFFYAGSSRIISTLWKVDDQATAELMSRFYHHLSKGQSPSAALRGAQNDLAKTPDWNHPFYWAAFVLQGEYRWSPDSR